MTHRRSQPYFVNRPTSEVVRVSGAAAAAMGAPRVGPALAELYRSPRRAQPGRYRKTTARADVVYLTGTSRQAIERLVRDYVLS